MSAQKNNPVQAADTVTFSIDGTEVVAREGQTILEAAQDAGMYIPRLCYLEGLPPGGHCRLCTVMVNGRPASACTFPASQDLVVENNTDELQGMRKRVLEMLFVEGNHVCPSCEASGDCELQALGYRLGPYRAPLPVPEPETGARCDPPGCHDRPEPLRALRALRPGQPRIGWQIGVRLRGPRH